jgi:hypothetical protein
MSHGDHKLDNFYFEKQSPHQLVTKQDTQDM